MNQEPQRTVGDSERSFEDGETIFNEGDESREMFIIRDGEVAISKRIGNGEIVLARRRRGEFFGEMALLESLPRMGTARAVGRVRLVVLHSGSFLQKIRRDPAFAFEMLHRLSGRFRQLNEQVIAFLAALPEDDPARRRLAQLMEVGSTDKPGR
jgi:CRP-like cAMP-binding protein